VAAGEQVGRRRDETHHGGVDDLRGRVGVRQALEQGVGRREQDRVHGTVAREAWDRPNGEGSGRREARGELGVDDLVVEDPRRGVAARKERTQDNREDDEGSQPNPSGYGCEDLARPGVTRTLDWLDGGQVPCATLARAPA
jgi:hypothetical protein